MKEEANLTKLVNASGFAFQMAVEHAVRSSHGHNFKVISREHAWRDPKHDREGFIDLVLQSSMVTWAVECKRTKEAKWIFLVDKMKGEPVPHIRCLWVVASGKGQRAAGWDDVNCKPWSPESQFLSPVRRGAEPPGGSGTFSSSAPVPPRRPDHPAR